MVFCLSLYVGCSGKDASGPSAPVLSDPTAPKSEVTKLSISATQGSSDGSATPILGYKVYCSQTPGYSTDNVLSVDVGLVSEYPLNQLIFGAGDWYLSVAEYDANGESPRSNEVGVHALDDGTFKPI